MQANKERWFAFERSIVTKPLASVTGTVFSKNVDFFFSIALGTGPSWLQAGPFFPPAPPATASPGEDVSRKGGGWAARLSMWFRFEAWHMCLGEAGEENGSGFYFQALRGSACGSACKPGRK